MAETEMQDLTQTTTLAADSIVLVTLDPTGTPLSRYMTFPDFLETIEDALSAITSGHAGTDTLLIIDGGVAKFSTIANFLAGIEDALSALTAVPDGADTIMLIDGGVAKYMTVQNFNTRYVELEPFSMVDQTDCATGDGKAYLHIPARLDGMSLVEVHAEVQTAGTTGTMSIQVSNGATDMLSTLLTIDTGETGSDTAATPAVIKSDGSEVVSENDLLELDFDAVHTTAAKGCLVTLGFA